jgi:hypothetical protein
MSKENKSVTKKDDLFKRCLRDLPAHYEEYRRFYRTKEKDENIDRLLAQNSIILDELSNEYKNRTKFKSGNIGVKKNNLEKQTYHCLTIKFGDNDVLIFRSNETGTYFVEVQSLTCVLGNNGVEDLYDYEALFTYIPEKDIINIPPLGDSLGIPQLKEFRGDVFIASISLFRLSKLAKRLVDNQELLKLIDMISKSIKKGDYQ